MVKVVIKKSLLLEARMESISRQIAKDFIRELKKKIDYKQGIGGKHIKEFVFGKDLNQYMKIPKNFSDTNVRIEYQENENCPRGSFGQFNGMYSLIYVFYCHNPSITNLWFGLQKRSQLDLKVIYDEVRSTLLHELNHIINYEEGKDAENFIPKDLPSHIPTDFIRHLYRYYFSKRELDSWTRQLYFAAKQERREFEDVVEEEANKIEDLDLEKFSKLSKQDVESVKKAISQLATTWKEEIIKNAKFIFQYDAKKSRRNTKQ